MGENVEKGNVSENGQASLNMTRTHTLPLITADTPENG
jgi:hypothetical protein